MNRPILIALLTCSVICTVTLQTTQAQNPAELFGRLANEIQTGQYDKAEATFREVIQLSESLGLGHTSGNDARINFIQMLNRIGKHEKALKICDEALNSARAGLGGQHPTTGIILANRGRALSQLGKTADAKQHYEQAIAILDKSTQHGKERATAYSDYAQILNQLGEIADARTFTTKGLELSRRWWGEDHQITATAINNLAMVEISLGDYKASEPLLLDALQRYRRNYGAEHVETVETLNNLGKLYVMTEDHEQSISFYQQALKIARNGLGEDHGTTILIMNNLGQALVDNAQFNEAIAIYRTALDAATKNLAPDHFTIPLLKHNLGSVLLNDDVDESIRLLQSAVELYGDKSLASKRKAAGSLVFLAGAKLKKSDKAGAIEDFSVARRFASESAWSVLPTLSSNEQKLFMKTTFNGTLFSSLSLASEFPDDQAVLTATAEWLANGKGVGVEALAAARDKNENKPFDSVTLDQVREKVAPQSVWVDIIRQEMRNWNGRNYAEQALDPHYVAWVVPHKGDVQRVDLGDAATIDALVAETRKLISNAGEKNGAIAELGEIEATKLANRTLTKLADAIWRPIEKKIEDDVSRVELSPDGQLWLVPWQALPLDDEKVFIQNYTLSTFIGGRAFVAPRANPPAKSSFSVLFADPDFDQNASGKRSAYQAMFRRAPIAFIRQRSAHFDTQAFNAVPLPGTAVEAAAVVSNMTKWMNGKTPIQYKGRYALESAAKELVSPKCAMFATHGFFRDDDEESFDPLQRCGLLFSGCNDPDANLAEDDGVLLGAEIAQMKLDGTELVVLSACETGVGRIVNGNGVAGLRRAFQLAGANAVVSTLWQIPDFDTAKLMNDFFRNLADGNSKAEALQKAQVNAIENRTKRNGAAHPYFWAAFGMSGR